MVIAIVVLNWIITPVLGEWISDFTSNFIYFVHVWWISSCQIPLQVWIYLLHSLEDNNISITTILHLYLYSKLNSSAGFSWIFRVGYLKLSFFVGNWISALYFPFVACTKNISISSSKIFKSESQKYKKSFANIH